ncbi:sigma-E processing peptidase SpoIIGA [Sporohalobacter salinus]|uniref:sigma-E processing peptidase SpoIIGA n=1 Tax=Sporohalobacter salinus TaxID=1494606 RepID=UPI0019613DD2|nr:sigma-E processing peptidase SpoIIGA [Sporohalobacter salinus]MBM7624388.1 stage II sporulation protein GA (sporulation sigma-E factor processing peptidase) [Sporohalobacter salinus]
MELTIYLDLLVIINLLMNYLLLWTTGRLIKIDYKIWRLILSAFFGTLYTILILFPQWQFWNNIFIYFFVSVLMVFLAYWPLWWKRLLKALGYFYLMTFLTAGVLMAGYSLNLQSQFREAVDIFNLSLQDSWILLLGISVLGLLGKFGWSLFQRKVPAEGAIVPLIIEFEGKKLEVEALIDTGNQLCDPLTEAPVIIVELESLLTVLPKEIKNIFKSYDLVLSRDKMATAVGDTYWANRFRLIPFSAIGSQQELLVGLKPDEISFKFKGDTITTDHVIVGVEDQKFSHAEDYTALMNPELFDV